MPPAPKSTLNPPTAVLRRKLLAWFDENKRDLPWRRTRDAYKIWVSEAMLQQTQVQPALPYYARFLREFPTVQTLASAPLSRVLKAWEGLGYYARARNLHAAAKEIVKKHGGKLPRAYDALLELPGFGPYTAAAVASIAFGEKRAVVDGNVARVLARLAAKKVDVKDARVRQKLHVIANDLVPAARAGDWNQALMELGATVCTPRNPACEKCPVSAHCLAFQHGVQEAIPLRVQRRPVPVRQFNALLFRTGDAVFLAQRKEPGLLHGLWELPTVDQIPRGAKKLGTVEHAYSHFTSRTTVYAAKKPPTADGEWVRVPSLTHALAGWTAKALARFARDFVACRARNCFY